MSLRALLERIVLSDPFRIRRRRGPMKRTAVKRCARARCLAARGAARAPAWRSRCPGSSRSRRARCARAARRAPRRYVSLYFPNGTADFWRPRGGSASGDAFKLSPILEPLAPVKPYVSVLTNVANYSPFGGHVEPSHSNLGASTWTVRASPAATATRTTASRSTR